MRLLTHLTAAAASVVRPLFLTSRGSTEASTEPQHAGLSPQGGVSRLIAFLVVGALLGGCQEAERPLAPTLSGPEFSHSPAHGLMGTFAFHSYPDGCCDISVMNADGTGVTQLTNTSDFDFIPIWSPNGQQIAFGRCVVDSGCNVMVMNADGTGVTQLNDNGFPGAWSPDGRQITFWSVDPTIEIFVMNADGSGVTRLTENGRECQVFRCGDRSTAWSPDGKQILFTSDRDGDSEIFVMNADGTGVTQLTDNDAWDGGERAGWSPNGKQIAFASDRDGDVEIFVMNADGSGVTQLTWNDFAADNDPFWSPNGKHIAFNSGPDLFSGEDIFVMNADGTEVTQLTFDAASSRLAWMARPLR